MTSKTLTIIPAKGSSSRIPQKNKKLLNGKPLVQHTIEHAIASKICGDIYVATDDLEIQKLAINLGVQSPFLRTEKDTDSITPVGIAALNYIQKLETDFGKTYDDFCLLLTTSPLRKIEDIQNSHKLFKGPQNFDAVSTFEEAPKHHFWSFHFAQNQNVQMNYPNDYQVSRKDMITPYFIDGSVYWAKVSSFKKNNGDQYLGKMGGIITPNERAIDVDTPRDFAFCEFLLQKQK